MGIISDSHDFAFFRCLSNFIYWYTEACFTKINIKPSWFWYGEVWVSWMRVIFTFVAFAIRSLATTEFVKLFLVIGKIYKWGKIDGMEYTCKCIVISDNSLPSPFNWTMICSKADTRWFLHSCNLHSKRLNLKVSQQPPATL